MPSRFPLRVYLARAWLGWIGACAVLTGGGLVAAAELPAPTVAWVQSTAMPDSSDGYAAGVIDGRLVVCGGTSWEGSAGNWTRKIYGTSTHAFDPTSQTWEKLPDAPVALGYSASAAREGRLYVIGGVQNGQSSSVMYVLQRTGGEWGWQKTGELPDTRVFANAVTIGSKIYVVGGTKEYEPFDTKGTCCTSKTARNTLWVLDLAAPTPKWLTLTGYPGELRWLHKAATDGVSIFLFGGIYKDAENSPVKKINEVLRYDPATDHWSRVAALPEDLQGAPVIGVPGRIILVSGSGTVASFDPATARFTTLNPLGEKVTMPSLAWIDPFVVGTGGEGEVEGPRRRSAATFIGRLRETPPPAPAGPKAP